MIKRRINAINAITEKPNWTTKIKDNTIRNKWIKELNEQGYSLTEVTDVLRLLTSKDKTNIQSVYEEGGPIKVLKLINEDLKKEIIELEKSLEDQKFYHPMSSEHVVDLVHPSSHSLKGDATLVNIRHTENLMESLRYTYTELMEQKRYKEVPEPYCFFGPTSNTDYNRLVDDKEKNYFCTIYDTMNNLNILESSHGENTGEGVPHHMDEGTCQIARKFSMWVPTHFHFNENTPDNDEYTHGVKFNGFISGLKYNKKQYDVVAKTLSKFIPNVYKDWNNPKGIEGYFLFKLAYIELKSNRIIYPGGSWHVEGTHHESIFKTGIYYYGMENINNNLIEFRTHSEPPKNLGYVSIEEDMCIIFENVEHRITDFTLKDPTANGYRKILVFFFCSRPSLDTRHVIDNNYNSLPKQFQIEQPHIIFDNETIRKRKREEPQNTIDYYSRKRKVLDKTIIETIEFKDGLTPKPYVHKEIKHDPVEWMTTIMNQRTMEVGENSSYTECCYKCVFDVEHECNLCEH